MPTRVISDPIGGQTQRQAQMQRTAAVAGGAFVFIGAIMAVFAQNKTGVATAYV